MSVLRKWSRRLTPRPRVKPAFDLKGGKSFRKVYAPGEGLMPAKSWADRSGRGYVRLVKGQVLRVAHTVDVPV